MNTKRHCLAVLAAVCLSAGGLANAQKNNDPGVSDSEIKLGMPSPLSGPVSAYSVTSKVAEAYFNRINEKGGINGRKVKLVIYDDQYSPPKTVEVVRRMVEEDEVAAVFGILGTATSLAVQRYLNAKKVPQLFTQTGAGQLNNSEKYPWTVPLFGAYSGEGRIFARQILASRPNAKIAVLIQNDDLGREVLKGLEQGLEGQSNAKIVMRTTYEVADPSVDSQVVQLRSSGADVFVMVSASRTTAQAIRKAYDIGWRPDRYVGFAGGSVKMALEPAGAEKAKGVMGLAVYKDPALPLWAKDPEVLEYREFMKAYAPTADANNGASVSGYLVAQAMAHVLRTAGQDLSRDNLRRVASNLKDLRLSMLLPGITLNNSSADLHAYAYMQPTRYNGVELEPVGPVLSMK